MLSGPEAGSSKFQFQVIIVPPPFSIDVSVKLTGPLAHPLLEVNMGIGLGIVVTWFWVLFEQLSELVIVRVTIYVPVAA